jgi:hypothetical protein
MRARQLNQVLRVASKKNSTPNRGTLQNQLIRTNHSGRALPVSTPVGNSFRTLRPPCLCAFCAKFPFPTSLFIATFAQETGLVAQGAAPVAGPEAFSYRIFPHDLRPFVAQVSAPTLFSARDLRLFLPFEWTPRDCSNESAFDVVRMTQVVNTLEL